MVDGVAEVSAEGGSKRAAEQAAAAEMLRRIGAEKEN
jgi:dsRNA-specific ribonuclease